MYIVLRDLCNLKIIQIPKYHAVIGLSEDLKLNVFHNIGYPSPRQHCQELT